MKRRDHRLLGRPERQQRDAGDQRLVQVHHVEGTVAQPPRRPGRDAGPEGESGDRSVVGHRHRLADHLDIRRQLVIGLPGSQHGDFMPARAELQGQVADVVLHPAGHVERVGADEPDSHPSSAAAGSGAARETMSAEKIRCSMCQSSGCRRIAAL